MIKISATVSFLKEVKIECDINTSVDRIQQLIYMAADKKDSFDDSHIISCLQIIEQANEEDMVVELIEVLN